MLSCQVSSGSVCFQGSDESTISQQKRNMTGVNSRVDPTIVSLLSQFQRIPRIVCLVAGPDVSGLWLTLLMLVLTQSFTPPPPPLGQGSAVDQATGGWVSLSFSRAQFSVGARLSSRLHLLDGRMYIKTLSEVPILTLLGLENRWRIW